MAEDAFQPLKQVGAIAYSPTSDVRFYVDEYRGRRYAAVRRFLNSPRYTGPTRSGVTLDAPLLEKVLGAVSTHAADGKQPEEMELGRFHRRPGIDLVVRIQVYKDQPGIDIREWLESETYKGWSKKGVRIPYDRLKELLSHLEALKQAMV